MDKKAGPCTILKIIENPEEKPPKRNKTHDLSALLFFGLTGAWEHKEDFFVSFRSISIRSLVSFRVFT